MGFLQRPWWLLFGLGTLAPACSLLVSTDGYTGGDDKTHAQSGDAGADGSGPCTTASNCDDGNPCTDDACSAGACTHQPNAVTSCDDGDACTTGDACAAGVCTGGAVVTDGACATQPRPIYRSVGASASLAASTGTLTIKGTTAIFSQAVANNVGVGDVIQYATDASGTPGALAFIHARVSATVFAVRTNVGSTPVPVTTTASWSVMRAYSSLAAAVNTVDRSPAHGGSENTAIAATLRDFDSFVGGKDITAAGSNQIWNVACYDDGTPDDLLVHVNSPWVTDPTHYLRIFTPVKPTEVGASQRHTGKWGVGYRRTHALHVWDRSVRLEGIALQQSRALGGAVDPNFDNRVYIFHTGSQGSDIRVADCFGRMTVANAANRVFDLYEDGPAGSGTTTIRIWNTIAISDGGGGSTAFLANTKAKLSFYNCTGVGTAGAPGFYQDTIYSASPVTVVNSIAASATGQAFHVGAGAPAWAIAYSASSDGTVTDAAVNSTASASNHASQTFTFAGPGSDYHLSSGSGNAALRGQGKNLTDLALFTDDIDGQARPAPPAAWDIGADQVE